MPEVFELRSEDITEIFRLWLEDAKEGGWPQDLEDPEWHAETFADYARRVLSERNI